MDIALLAEARQRKIDEINNGIQAEEARRDQELTVLAELQRLMSQSSFTIQEINYLIEASK